MYVDVVSGNVLYTVHCDAIQDGAIIEFFAITNCACVCVYIHRLESETHLLAFIVIDGGLYATFYAMYSTRSQAHYTLHTREYGHDVVDLPGHEPHPCFHVHFTCRRVLASSACTCILQHVTRCTRESTQKAVVIQNSIARCQSHGSVCVSIVTKGEMSDARGRHD